jgi:hypothetical protein
MNRAFMRETKWLAALLLAGALAAGLAERALAQAFAQSLPGEQRVALVIGNAQYREAPLRNPVNDARAVAQRLRELGFEVVLRENATRRHMGDALAEFTRLIKPSGVALIFYAGHGVQVRGRNYLIPVDMTLQTETDLRFQAVDVSTLTDELELAQSRVAFLVLDACRNNPFERRLRGAGRGLAAVDAARGTLIAYATAPGSVAADGDGQYGTYTEALLNALALPGLKAEEVFKRVRIDVSAATQNQQVPWESSSLTGDFVFYPGAGAAPPAQAVAPADREVVFWQSIQASRRPADYEAYLQRYPQGEFAPLARSRLAELQRVQTQQPAQQSLIPQLPGAQPPQIAAVPVPIPAPAPQVQVGEAIGCFKDAGNPLALQGRDLDGFVMNWHGMTPKFCVEQCARKGFTYAGVQYGSFCFCGNSYGKNGTATNCTMPCNGDYKQKCGGEWANMVYRAK